MIIKKIFKKIKKKLSSITGIGNISKNVNHTSYDKNCLICYIRSPFEEGPSFYHQNGFQALAIANIFMNLKYNVDVIDYFSKHVILTKKYDVVFDICVKNPPLYKNNIDKNTKRIVYFTGSESEFANNAEKQRINDLYNRRGVKLKLRRQAPLIDKDVENFDGAIMIGNEYEFSTYDKFQLKKKFTVPNTGYNFNFNFDEKIKNKRSFLYFGSIGCVHKGLDLLLEIFAELGQPYVLHVCGLVEREKDFFEEYKIELLHTDNIIYHGFMDIKSDAFKEICSECVFTILPSCSEACAGSIATCMSAGLIPICSKICGYDDGEVITLKDCRIDTIKKAIIEASKMNIDEIKKMSASSVELINKKYNMNIFRKEMSRAIEDIL